MYQRSRFHRAMKAHPPASAKRSGLIWGLAILWGFLAYGPGAVLGNFFFSDPIFTDLKSVMGVPSLWVWQMLFWLFGVVLVWWVSYSIGYGHTHEVTGKPIRLGMPQAKRSPDWISSGLSRVVNRSGDASSDDPNQVSERLLVPELEIKQPAVKPKLGGTRHS